MRLIDAEPIERALFKLADKSLAKNPYENARVCAFRRAFELILGAPTIATPPNDPLTLEELRKMDGEPVFVKILNNQKCDGTWMLSYHGDCMNLFGESILKNYGKTWLAYRRKPEEG